MRSRFGFTLIELLVVVGIIAILALVALPNFLEAQTRAKVSAVKSDLRVIVTSIEMYTVDHNHYPPAIGVGEYYTPSGLYGNPYTNPVSQRLIPLTTPIAYVTSVPKDRFPTREGLFVSDPSPYDTYDYIEAEGSKNQAGSGLTSGGAYRICSPGPDLLLAYGGMTYSLTIGGELGVDYDPTNGTVSVGDIVRVGPLFTKYGDPLDPNNPNRPAIVRVPTYVEQYQ